MATRSSHSLWLTTFAGASDPEIEKVLHFAQRRTAHSGTKIGIDRVISVTRGELLQTNFYGCKKLILDQPKGAGFWLWKPYIILKALERIEEDDVVVYWDVGRIAPNLFRRSIEPLVKWCKQQEGILPGVPIVSHGAWTKRDCFYYMKCDSPQYWNAEQIQATFSLWSGKRAKDLVSEWLEWCCDARCLTDQPNECGLPNLPGFREHRHDQSILTNLCIKHGVRALDPLPIAPGAWTKNLNIWAEAYDENKPLPAFLKRPLSPSSVIELSDRSGEVLELLRQARAVNDVTRMELIARLCLAKVPHHVESLRVLEEICTTSGRIKEAAEYAKISETLRKRPASFRRPEPARALTKIELARGLRSIGLLDKAADILKQAIAERPGDASLRNAHGNLLLELGRPGEAEKQYREAITIAPLNGEYHNNLGQVLKRQRRLNQAIACYRRCRELKADASEAHSNELLTLNSLPASDEGLLAEHVEWARQHAEKFYPSQVKFPNDRTLDRKLRVGYVSPDFRRHAVANFLDPLLKAHNRERIEVFCYSNGSREDERTRELKKDADQCRNIHKLTNDEVVHAVRADQIDILVDLSGHTAGNRLLVFARRAAPIQVTYLGYPNTIGLSTIDYRITDAIADPPGTTEQNYSERLLRLANPFICFTPPADSPPPGERRSSDRRTTFGVFNSLFKVTDEMLGIWAKILLSVRDSILLLKADALVDESSRAHLEADFARFGVGSDRLKLVGRAPKHVDHLRMYQQVDIALDTYPYNGTTTTCESLWMGVPVVTLSGRAHHSRVGRSLLSAIGCEGLVAESPDEYVRIATALANEHTDRINLAAGMRDRLRNSPLTDAVVFAARLEQMYSHIWSDWIKSSQ